MLKIKKEESSFFKLNLFSIKYKGSEKTIIPPNNFDLLLDKICSEYKINEKDKSSLRIYQNNTLIKNDDEYKKLKDLDSIINLLVKEKELEQIDEHSSEIIENNKKDDINNKNLLYLL